MKKLLNHGILIGALLASTALPLCAQQGGMTNGAGENKEMRHEQKHAFHEKMEALIKQQDAELQELVTKMNKAPKGQRTDAIAAVVNKLVEDRLAIHKQMEAFHEKMHESKAPHEEGTPSP